MVRVAVMSIIIYVNFIIESTLFKYLEIRRIHPSAVVALVASYSILRGSVEGALVGLCAGLLQDVFFGSSIGYYAIIYMTIGYICGIPTESFFKDNFFIPIIFCVASTLASGLFIYVTSFLIRGRLDFIFYFNNIILPETVYTGVFSIFIYRIIFGINRRLENYEHERRKVF